MCLQKCHQILRKDYIMLIGSRILLCKLIHLIEKPSPAIESQPLLNIARDFLSMLFIKVNWHV